MAAIVADPGDFTANLRRTPNGELIQPIHNGLRVTKLYEQGNWTWVKHDGQIGTIFSELVREDNSPYLFRSDSHFVRVYQKANVDSKLLSTHLNGTAVVPLAVVGDFTQVFIRGLEGNYWIGYVETRYISEPHCG